MQLEDCRGKVGLGEREFLISATFGSATLTSIGRVLGPDNKVIQSRKCFDWMLDEQFANLQLTAIHFPVLGYSLPGIRLFISRYYSYPGIIHFPGSFISKYY